MYYICDNPKENFLGKDGRLTTKKADALIFPSREAAVFGLLLSEGKIKADLFVCQE